MSPAPAARESSDPGHSALGGKPLLPFIPSSHPRTGLPGRGAPVAQPEPEQRDPWDLPQPSQSRGTRRTTQGQARAEAPVGPPEAEPEQRHPQPSRTRGTHGTIVLQAGTWGTGVPGRSRGCLFCIHRSCCGRGVGGTALMPPAPQHGAVAGGAEFGQRLPGAGPPAVRRGGAAHGGAAVPGRLDRGPELVIGGLGPGAVLAGACQASAEPAMLQAPGGRATLLPRPDALPLLAGAAG